MYGRAGFAFFTPPYAHARFGSNIVVPPHEHEPSSARGFIGAATVDLNERAMRSQRALSPSIGTEPASARKQRP